jgi:hypothetical protein
LIINRSIIEPKRTELREALNSLVDSGHANQVELLDFDYFFDKLQSLSTHLIVKWSDQLRHSQFEFYDQNMRFTKHVAGVPFISGRKSGVRPAEHIISQLKSFFATLHRDSTSKYRKHPKFILTATFGFGKTETLHAIAHSWLSEGGKVLYVPAALIEPNGVSNTSNFVSSLLDILCPNEITLGELPRLVLRDALRKWCETSRDTILLIDGLDEHPAFLRSRVVAALWHLLQDLGLPCVITVRDELYESRVSEFQVDITNPQLKNAPQLERVKLTEWTVENILEFLGSFAEFPATGVSEEFVRFRNVVTEGRFDSIYGDIPRRPLFLGMLATDAAHGADPVSNLSLVYFNYFKSKLARDIIGTLKIESLMRSDQLLQSLGREEISSRLMSVMTEFAESHVREVSLEDGIQFEIADERTIDALDNILSKNRLDHVDREEILLHSLLQPAARNSKTGIAQVKFSHRSYLEWFLARSMFLKGRKEHLHLPEAVEAFLVDMVRLGERAFAI